jgi:hypothetical protein
MPSYECTQLHSHAILSWYQGIRIADPVIGSSVEPCILVLTTVGAADQTAASGMTVATAFRASLCEKEGWLDEW